MMPLYMCCLCRYPVIKMKLWGGACIIQRPGEDIGAWILCNNEAKNVTFDMSTKSIPAGLMLHRDDVQFHQDLSV